MSLSLFLFTAGCSVPMCAIPPELQVLASIDDIGGPAVTTINGWLITMLKFDS